LDAVWKTPGRAEAGAAASAAEVFPMSRARMRDQLSAPSTPAHLRRSQKAIVQPINAANARFACAAAHVAANRYIPQVRCAAG